MNFNEATQDKPTFRDFYDPSKEYDIWYTHNPKWIHCRHIEIRRGYWGSKKYGWFDLPNEKYTDRYKRQKKLNKRKLYSKYIKQETTEFFEHPHII